MSEVLLGTSPALSDDGLSFQDAADGSSSAPSSPLNTFKELKDDNGAKATSDLDNGLKSKTSTQATSAGESATTSPSAANKSSKAKGSGVAALMAKYQNGAEGASKSSPASTSRSASPNATRRVVTPSASKNGDAGKATSSIETPKPKSDDAAGKDRTLTKNDQDAIETSSVALTKAVKGTSLDNDKIEIPPSKGALSLLDPNETIKNPFGGSATPTLESAPFSSSDEQATAAPSVSQSTSKTQIEPKRFSTISLTEEAEDVPDTPTPSQSNRFSTVSLSTTAPLESKRDTIYANPSFATASTDSSVPDSSTAGQAEFVARQNARLTKAEGDKRSSIEGAEKIKEKLNELRYGHSRDNSAISNPDGEGRRSLDATMAPPSSATIAEESQWDDAPPSTRNETIDWDFWGNVMSNYQDIARTQPRQLSRAIQAGIPGALRGMMWQLMSSSKDEEMEIIYAYYLKQTSPHEKMIRKDLARTFPGQDYFQDGKGIGQENLFNVVKAYSLYDEECGYCQGMQFVVGPLLLNMPDEEAFSTLVRLMKSYDLRGHFVPNMPALQLRLFQFDRLLEETLPLLHRHLVRSGIKSSMYASGWFMTLFSYRSPLNICFRILDSVFAEGIEALFRFALALMKKNEEELLKLSFEEAVPLLAARVFDVYKSEDGEEGGDREELLDLEGSGGAKVGKGYRVNEFVRDAFEFKITPFMLDSFASDFAEQVRVATAHRREIETLKIQNKNLQAKVKNLEDQLGAVQQEHVDLVKNVVMTKLAKEEMAEELVRYKLMYAEATLLADQSGVNPSTRHLSTSTSNSSILRDR